jgi:hypothetical protein
MMSQVTLDFGNQRNDDSLIKKNERSVREGDEDEKED